MSTRAIRKTRLGAPTLLAAIVALVVVAESAYVVSTYVFLRSALFQEIVSSDDGSLKIAFASAWSPYPGLVLVRALEVGGHTSGVRWQLKADRARLGIDLLKLRRHIVAITMGRGAGVDFSLVLDNAPADASRGDGSPNSPAAPAAPARLEASNDWAISLQGLALTDFRQLRLNEQIVTGDVEARATIEIARDGKLSLPWANIRLKDAKILRNDTLFAHVAHADVALELPPIDTEAENEALIRALRTTLDFDVVLENDVVLRTLTANVPWLTTEDQGGRMQARLSLREGRLDAGSHFETVYEKIVATVVGQRVEGRARLLCDVEATPAGPEIKLGLSFEDYAVQRAGAAKPAVTGKGLALSLRGPAQALGARLADWSASVTVPTASFRDLSYLNQFLPRGLGLTVRGGAGDVRVDLAVDAERPDEARGHVHVSGKRVDLAYGTISLRGDVVVDVVVTRSDLIRRSFHVDGSKIALANVRTVVPGEEEGDASLTTAGWWGEVSTPQGALALKDPVSFSGRIAAKGRDLRPILSIYAAIGGLPSWVRDNVALKALNAEGRVRVDESALFVPAATLTAADLTVQAWFQRVKELPVGRMKVQYKAITVGLGLVGDETEIKIVGVDRWFRDKPKSLLR